MTHQLWQSFHQSLSSTPAFARVNKGTFRNVPVAVKTFRNSTEEKAFKEIEMMFALRHPNIIGMYAWFQLKGELVETGIVMELAHGGDLRELYTGENEEQKYTFKLGLSIVLGAAKGLAHMHSMPAPAVHRDVKSMNILLVNDENAGQVGKVGDCGESRRINLDVTMTQTGSPLWAAVSCLCMGVRGYG